MVFNPSDLTAVAPEITLLAVALVVLFAELLVTRRALVLQAIAVLGLLVVMAVALLTTSEPTGAFNGMVARDGIATFLKVLVAGVALLAALMSREYWREAYPSLAPPSESNPPLPPPAIAGGVGRASPSIAGGASNVRHGEYYALLLLAAFGMMVLASATDLLTIFLGIETMSLSLYVLAGIRTERARSSEAALKYLLLGAFFTGFLLYGMALIYGATGGKTNLADIAMAITRMGDAIPPHLYIGIGLVMVGLLFKVAAAPFHFWSPDVYQGAPTPVTAFMSAGPKAAAFVAFYRLFGWALPDLSAVWTPVLWAVAALTMTVGNIIALAQQDIKRMLAYSSIAHAGYLLLAILAAANENTREAAGAGLLFYLAAYYLMNIGAFTVAMLVSRAKPDGDYQLGDYQGLATSNPLLAAAMTLFMVSLSGIPPTAGFFAKLYVFSAAVKAGLVPLVVIAVLNSAVSVYYYLRIVVYMYMKPQPAPLKLRVAPAMAAVLLICALGIAKFGILPGDLMRWATESVTRMSHPTPTAVMVNPDETEVAAILDAPMIE